MTDDEIIKALECCMRPSACGECPYLMNSVNSKRKSICVELLHEAVFELIKRQRAESEKLKQNNDILSRNADNAFQDGLNESEELYKNEVETEIKSKAIKEFAERLKTNIDNGELYNDSEDYCLTVYHINSLLEEMTEGESNA